MAKDSAKKIVCLPVTYEFGGELIKNVYQVHAIEGYKIVCHEAGKECLYPSADEHYIIERNTSRDEIVEQFVGTEYVLGKGSKAGRIPFIPEGKSYDFETDVVIFPRKKKNMASMNWDKWQLLVDELISDGISVFVAGHEDYSFHLKGCSNAWDYDNQLEASIWAIKNSKIRLGLITGLSVLSLMCAREVWVLTSVRGEKALNSRGQFVHLNYLQHMDHARVGWGLVPYLEEVPCIMEEIRRKLR